MSLEVEFVPIDNSTIKACLKDIKAYIKNRGTPPNVTLYDQYGLMLRLSKKNLGLGKWYIFRPNHQGKRTRLYLGQFNAADSSNAISIEEAKLLALRGEHFKDLEANSYLEFLNSKGMQGEQLTNITLIDICERYILDKGKLLRPNSLRLYSTLLKTMQKLDMNCPLSQLNNAYLKEKLQPLFEEGKINTLNSILTFIGTCTKYSDTIELTTNATRVFKLEVIFNISHQQKERASLQDVDLGEFVDFLRNTNADAITKLFLVFVLLAANRKSEIIAIEPSWIKIEEANNMNYLHFPASVMKNKNEFVLPLTPLLKRACDILTASSNKKFTISDYNFATNLLKEWKKYKITVHGFRSTFSTLMHKIDHANHMIIDMLIAHKYKQTSVSSVYNRYGYYEEKKNVKLKFEAYLKEHTNIELLLDELAAQIA